MNNRLYIIITSLVLIFLTQSCFKEDEKVPVYIPGDLETMTTNVGNTYAQQVYFNFESMENLKVIDNVSWDLAFECKDEAWHVVLNSSLMMWAGNTQDTNFALINSSEGVDLYCDVSSGNMDSTAIGEWYQDNEGVITSKKQVYIIDRGIDDVGSVLGLKKMSLDIRDDKYVIRYANLDGSDEQQHIIEKDVNYNYIHLSFETGMVSVEPPKDQWSLKFSRYSTILFTNEGDAYPYNVLGVLLNPKSMVASRNSDDFYNITLQDTIQYEFSKSADLIGYSWKLYDFDEGIYTIIPDRNYLIRNHDGFYYKLRFTRFYDDQGRKGSITYEFLRL